MRELSIFIDESGDFGEVFDRPAYYLVTMVFHNQDFNVTDEIAHLERHIRETNLPIDYIHTGPVIRREDIFKNYSIDDRRRLIYLMQNFYNKCPVSHATIKVDRKEAPDKIALSGKIARALSGFLNSHQEYFDSFDSVKVYYDGGQVELSAILNAVFSIYFTHIEFIRVDPREYRFLQIADYICSMELLKLKYDENRLSKSEKQFFYKPQELKKTFLKNLDRKRL